MKIRSKIYLTDVVQNTDPHHAANDKYIKVWVIDENGNATPAHMTLNDVARIVYRGKRNPEDHYPMYVPVYEKVTTKVSGWLTSLCNLVTFKK